MKFKSKQTKPANFGNHQSTGKIPQNLRAKKALGQNFLTSQDIVKKIVKASNITEQDTVIEIGPGLGILTIELAKIANKVIAIELDSSLIPILKENLARSSRTNSTSSHTGAKIQPEKVTILNQDALKFTPKEVMGNSPYKVVANIPYYITSPLITHFLTQKNPPISMTLLVQKEVAEKICAQTPSNSKEGHSVLSIMTQLYATPSIKFTVHAGSFTPAPKVESAVIHLVTHKTKRNQNPKSINPKTTPAQAKKSANCKPATSIPSPNTTEEKIIQLAKRAFSGKRKKLSNTLRQELVTLSKTAPTFAKTIKDLRPEDLSIKDWEKLVANIN